METVNENEIDLNTIKKDFQKITNENKIHIRKVTLNIDRGRRN